MNFARLLPLMTTLLLAGLLTSDAVFNGRGADVLLIPGLVLVVMAAASLMVLLFKPAHLVNTHSVSPIVFSHQGRLVWLSVSALLVVLVPRIGIPVLTISIARYRDATFKVALLLGACAAAMIEVIFIAILGLGFPPVILW